MNMSRRSFFHAIAGAAAVSRVARAEAYPARPVHIVVGFPAGTSSDITARLIGQWLSERFGQQFVVENRPGAGTNVATASVAHASPDAYSLLWVTQTNTINATLYDSLNFDFIRDIQPVASIVRLSAVMLVNSSLPTNSVPEFVAYAKANPGKINMCSPGIGSANHVFGELFEMMAGIKLVHVPYRGSWFADLMSGQVQVTFNLLPASLGLIKGGKVRALAVTSPKRQGLLPDVPSVGEFVPGYEATAWFGIGAPKATSRAIVEKLNREINAGLNDAKVAAQLIALGGEAVTGAPGDFGKFIAEETDKWRKVIKFANIRVD